MKGSAVRIRSSALVNPRRSWGSRDSGLDSLGREWTALDPKCSLDVPWNRQKVLRERHGDGHRPLPEDVTAHEDSPPQIVAGSLRSEDASETQCLAPDGATADSAELTVSRSDHQLDGACKGQWRERMRLVPL